jgi:ABC-type multidrug transport system permease subunit
MKLPSYVYESPRPVNFWMPEPVFMKPWMYTIAPIFTAYFINRSHQFVCLYVYIARQRLGKNTYGNDHIYNMYRASVSSGSVQHGVIWKVKSHITTDG